MLLIIHAINYYCCIILLSQNNDLSNQFGYISRVLVFVRSTKMRILKKLTIIWLFCKILIANGLNDFTSQTFVQLHPINQNIVLQQSLWYRLINIYDDCTSSGFQIYGIYQDSTNDQAKLAKYFTFDNKTELSVKGDSVSTTDRDIRAEWVGLPSDYNGVLALAPAQKRIGAALELRRALSKQLQFGLLRNFWLGCTLSFEALNYETGIQAVSGPQEELLAAFNNPELVYGKIAPSTSSKGLSEARFTFGVDFKPSHQADFTIYTYLSIPGSMNDQTAQYLFEALRGYNHHFGIGFGTHIQLPIYQAQRSDLLFYIDGDVNNLFSCKQMRVLDLDDKPWSRFLLLNKADGTSTVSTPATQVLTQNVHVKPYTIGDLAFGFRWQFGGLQAEIGYALWGHGTEILELVDNFSPDYGIAGSTLTSSASESNIATLAANDTTFTPITQADLNLLSGAAGSVITNRINGALGYICFGEKLDALFGIGVFFEVPQNNAMVKQWGVWGKTGLFF